MEPIVTTQSTAALQHQQAIRCKLAFNSDLRCCMLALPASWDNLRADVARLFNLAQPFALKYVDTEGDSILFDSTSELQDAVSEAVAQDTYLRLSVHLSSNAAMEMDNREPGRGKRGGKRASKHNFGAGEMEVLLDQLEARGLGQHKKRGARLLRKMGGDIDAVTNLLREYDTAQEARRLARQQKKLGRGGRASSLGVDDPRKAAREERKKERMAKKQLQRESDNGLVSLREGWPAGVDGLYLDGNNMLFLSAALRKHALGRGQRWIAEDMLSSIAESFARAKVAEGLRTTIMIYDSIAKNRCGLKALAESAHFSVASARPEFTTSDDAMVAWAQALSPAKAKTSLFVTSDRELQRRLREVGALVAKPKQWLELARRTVEADQKQPLVPQSTMSEESEEALPEQQQQQGADAHDDDSGLDAFLEEWGKKMILSDTDDAGEV